MIQLFYSSSKTTYSILTMAFILILGSNALYGQMDVCVDVDNDIVTVNYIPAIDYNTPPFDAWNSQVITLRYPDNITLTWGAITQESGFNFTADNFTPGPGVDGGDGFIYKIFNSANTPSVSFNTGVTAPVFNIVINTSDSFDLEAIASSGWLTGARVATVNHAINGNIFRTMVTSCGSQTVNPLCAAGNAAPPLALPTGN